MNTPVAEPSGKRKSRTKQWTLGGVITAILLTLYSAARPAINQQFGINLPEIANNEAPINPGTLASNNRTPASNYDPRSVEANDAAAADEVFTSADEPTTAQQADHQSPPPLTKKPAREVPAKKPAPSKDSSAVEPEGALVYGMLREVGRDVFMSPAGLRYTPGSAEGHRLDHLERHVSDQPTRPGKHGVFMGGMEGALKVIDEAFQKAKQGGKGVTKEVDSEYEGRVIYTVDLRRKIGFIGGKEGNRMNKPTAFKVQLVLDGDRVITSYPR